MTSTNAPIVKDNEKLGFMKVDDTDFDSMTRGAQIRQLEVEGYLAMPNVLDQDQVRRLKKELAEAKMDHKSYSIHQTFSFTQPQWISRAVAELIGFKPVIDFIQNLTGPDIVFTRGFFQRTHPGSPGISLHTDGQPHGSNLFGYEGSCPRLLRVLYYLDDLTPERAPFRIVPRSHLSYHAQANPYVRYESHPEEITLCLPAGSAVIIPALLFHGTHPNCDDRPRELIQLGYRPAWAGPVQPMQEWDPDLVSMAPEAAKPFLQSLNTNGVVWEQPHKPVGMTREAPGINPSRWKLD